MFVGLFFYWYKFLFFTLAAGTAPCVGQFLKGSAGRDVLLGVALFGVVGVFAGAFELSHNRIFVLGLERGEPRPSPEEVYLRRGADAPVDAVRVNQAGCHLQRTGDTMAPSFFNSAKALSTSLRSIPVISAILPAFTGAPNSRMACNTFSFIILTPLLSPEGEDHRRGMGLMFVTKKASPRGNCPLVAEQLGCVSNGGPKGLEGVFFTSALTASSVRQSSQSFRERPDSSRDLPPRRPDKPSECRR